MHGYARRLQTLTPIADRGWMDRYRRRRWAFEL